MLDLLVTDDSIGRVLLTEVQFVKSTRDRRHWGKAALVANRSIRARGLLNLRLKRDLIQMPGHRELWPAREL